MLDVAPEEPVSNGHSHAVSCAPGRFWKKIAQVATVKSTEVSQYVEQHLCYMLIQCTP